MKVKYEVFYFKERVFLSGSPWQPETLDLPRPADAEN
jgi:hypothetical protein